MSVGQHLATERKPGSGRQKTARTEKNVRYLKMLISKSNMDFGAAPLNQILTNLKYTAV